jgi:hypothetical protein
VVRAFYGKHRVTIGDKAQVVELKSSQRAALVTAVP